jgi:hypothetical protein
MEWGSTTNEWEFICRACDMRYNQHLERMDSDVNWRIDPEPDEAYERAAARARNNDFEDTNGKDWT